MSEPQTGLDRIRADNEMLSMALDALLKTGKLLETIIERNGGSQFLTDDEDDQFGAINEIITGLMGRLP